MNGFEFLYQTSRNWQRAAIEEQDMLISASEVIWRRSWQILTGRISTGEAARMVFEKPVAFAFAAQLAAAVAVSGGDAATVTRAAVLPLRTEARRNARRLRS